MRRKRQQDGNIFKARGIWYIRYFDTRVIGGEVKRVRIAKQIAKVRDTIDGMLTTITRAKARELAGTLLAKINQPDRAPETALSLIDFVERLYLPRMLQQKRPSTVKGYRDIWNNHLKARCAGLWMPEIRTCDVQRILDDIAKPGMLTSNSLRHIKSHISAIFSYAKQQGFFDGENPARNTAIPPSLSSEETYAYSLEEIAQILSVLPEPAATVFAAAAFTGSAPRGNSRLDVGKLSRFRDRSNAVDLARARHRTQNAQKPGSHSRHIASGDATRVPSGAEREPQNRGNVS